MEQQQLGRDAADRAVALQAPALEFALPPSRPEDWFRVDVECDDVAARVRPIGELDIASVGELDGSLEPLLALDARRIVLDLRGLTFMGSCGLKLVFRWRRSCDEAGVEFALVQGSGPVKRVFELAGLEDRLPFVPDAA